MAAIGEIAAFGEIVKNGLSSFLGPDLETKTNRLQGKLELLEKRKDDVQEELGGEEVSFLHGKKRKREVGFWLSNVELIKRRFQNLRGEVESCRVYKRQMLTKEVEKMTEVVTDLLELSVFPKGYFLEVDTIDHFDELVYQSKHLDYILHLFWNSPFSRIGIWDTEESLGRTTLSEHINDKLSNKSTFLDHVYQVRVSPEFSTHKLQGDIAHALNLDLSSENDERERATILSEAFKKKGRSLLILDDVREYIDTEKIGIPVGKGCKLIITSRSKEVCQQMECQRIIQVSKVSGQEACQLLLKKLSSVQLQQ